MSFIQHACTMYVLYGVRTRVYWLLIYKTLFYSGIFCFFEICFLMCFNNMHFGFLPAGKVLWAYVATKTLFSRSFTHETIKFLSVKWCQRYIWTNTLHASRWCTWGWFTLHESLRCWWQWCTILIDFLFEKLQPLLLWQALGWWCCSCWTWTPFKRQTIKQGRF